MRRVTCIAVLATAVLALPDAAAADDAGVYQAFHGRDGDIQKAAAAYKRAARRAASHKLRSRSANRAVIRADLAINTVLKAVAGDVMGQRSSSDAGTKAQKCAFLDLVWWDRANNWEIRGLRAANHHHRVRAARYLRRANRAIKRQDKYGVCQRKQFAAAGIPNPARTGGL